MFERFSREARQVVIDAQGECRRLHDSGVTSVHLLRALAETDHPVADLLVGAGLSREALDEQSAEALGTLGIDVTAVREAVEATFGEGALHRVPRRGSHRPFRADAKKALELSLRESIRLKTGEIRAEHLALGLLREPGPLLRPVLLDLEVDVPALQRALEQSLRPAA